MPKEKSDHVHKYKREAIGSKGYVIMRCMTCPHFLPDLALAEGRETECWSCGEPFVMRKSHTELQKPLCDKCREIRRARRESERKLA
jgi:hypothetical protein